MNPQREETTPVEPPVETPRPSWQTQPITVPQPTPSVEPLTPSVTKPTTDIAPNPATDPVVQPVVEPATVPTVEAATEPTTTPLPDQAPQSPVEPKKINKKLIIGGIIAIIVLLAIGGYIVYAYYIQPAPASTADTAAPVTASLTTNNPALDAATQSLTNGATTESSLATTNDSSDGTDASNTAATVGSSIDENNF